MFIFNFSFDQQTTPPAAAVVTVEPTEMTTVNGAMADRLTAKLTTT